MYTNRDIQYSVACHRHEVNPIHLTIFCLTVFTCFNECRDSVLEDFPCVESLRKSFFYPENQCSNTTGENYILVSEQVISKRSIIWMYKITNLFFPSGGVQKDIAASGFVPCNSDSKDCLDIEVIITFFLVVD